MLEALQIYQKIDSDTGEFFKILKNTYFVEHLRTATYTFFRMGKNGGIGRH